MPTLTWAGVTSLLPVAALISFVAHVDGVLVNRTIDDQLGDSVTGVQPVYLPDNWWSLGSSCGGCMIHPGLVDVDKAFGRTWHDTTHNPSGPEQVINATFSGVAVYVFNIIANTVNATTTLTNLSFTLDGELAGYYLHAPDSTADILYNVSVFSQTGLADKQHTLEIRPTGSFANSLVLFDYITYTVNEDTQAPAGLSATSDSLVATSTISSTESTESSAAPISSTESTESSPAPTQTHELASPTSRPTAAIVGGAIAGVAIIALVVAGVLYALRCRRQSRRGTAVEAAGVSDLEGRPRVPVIVKSRVGPLPPTAAPEDRASGVDDIFPATYPHVALPPQGDAGAARRHPATATSPEFPTRPTPSYTAMEEPIRPPPPIFGVAPPASSRTPSTSTSSSRTGKSTLRARVTMLQEELQRLRTERELHALYVEPPPVYEE